MTQNSPNYSIERKCNLMIQTVISSLENAEEKNSQIPQQLRALKLRRRTLKSLHKIFRKPAVKKF